MQTMIKKLFTLTYLAFILFTHFALAQNKNPDYAKLLYYTRELTTRPSVMKFLNETFKEELAQIPEEAAEKFDIPKEALRRISETQFLAIIERHPELYEFIDEYLKKVPESIEDETARDIKIHEAWQAKFNKMADIEELKTNLLKYANPLEPYVFKVPKGKPGFEVVEISANHAFQHEGKMIEAVAIDEKLATRIRKCKQYAFNVFDFDNMIIADAIIEAHENGAKIMGGIDKNVIDSRPEVKAVYDKVTKAGIKITPVNPTNLNHQKQHAFDWDHPDLAEAWYLSANNTYSCMRSTGDLTVEQAEQLSAAELKYAISNANHVLVLKGQLPALVAYHNLSLSISEKYLLRGKEFPLSSAFRIMGEKISDDYTTSLYLAFTPGGGMKNINRNVFGQIIQNGTGDIYLGVFVASSDDLYDEIKNAVIADYLQKKKELTKVFFVGDTSFAMREYSIALPLSGLYRETYEHKSGGEVEKLNIYVDDPTNELVQTLSAEDMEKFRSMIKIAPEVYGETHITLPDGTSAKLTSKIHHKLMARGNVSTPGNSFNPSGAADTNTEQVVVLSDPKETAKVKSIIMSLYKRSEGTVYNEMKKRNAHAIKVLGQEKFDKVVKKIQDKLKADCDAKLKIKA
ncbi:MAG: hypothetical protein JNM93_00015 [Bacteriovoracaceae bacterium]|nr:hypothetical protein [Bacteriovoracaceae bacterium]